MSVRIVWLISFSFLIIFSGCRITGTGTVNDAELVVENLTSAVYYVTFEDGSTGPYPEYAVYPGNSISKIWQAGDALFVLNDGNLILNYHDAAGNYETAFLTIELGRTRYFTISDYITSLQVRNQTFSQAWFSLNGGNYIYLESSASRIINFGDPSSPLEVALYYSGYHVFSNQVEIFIQPYTLEQYDIVADGGAIRITNNSLSDLVQVYIAPSDDLYWGDNVLSGRIEPGESVIWTVIPGWWDILVVDEWEEEFTWLNNYIALDSTYEFFFRQSESQQDIPGNIKRKGISEGYALMIEQKGS